MGSFQAVDFLKDPSNIVYREAVNIQLFVSQSHAVSSSLAISISIAIAIWTMVI